MPTSAIPRMLGMAGLLAVTLPSQAHHSFRSQYDADQPVAFNGIVTKVEWMNPHVYFYIDVENEESGEIEQWGFEMGPPHMLQRRGWKHMLQRKLDADRRRGRGARNARPRRQHDGERAQGHVDVNRSGARCGI